MFFRGYMRKLCFLIIISLIFFSCSDDTTKGENFSSHTVTFDSDGGTEVPKQTVAYGKTASKPDYNPSKFGYTFLNWYYINSSQTEEEYPFSLAVTKDITITAKYSINSYTIYFDSNGAVNNSGKMSSLSCTYGEEYSLPSCTFTNTGKSFAGWSTTADSEKAEYADEETIKNLSYTNGQAITLYAIWSENPYHLISYELNGGSNSSLNLRKFLESSYVILYDAEKSGYTFDAWYEDSDFSGKKISGWYAGDYSDDVTLYASWSANQYTVTLMSNEKVEGSQSVYSDEFIADVPPPAPDTSDSESWTFGGYFTEEYAKGLQCISAQGKCNTPYTFAKDLTLYAAWTYEISYDTSAIANDISFSNPNSTEYTGEREITLLPLTLKNGYCFDGWLDEEGNSATSIEKGSYGEKNFTAKGVSLIEYTITYNKNGGEWDTEDGGYTPVEAYTIKSDEIYLPSKTDILKDGFSFAGWYKSEDLSGKAIKTIESSSYGNIELWAKWEEN